MLQYCYCVLCTASLRTAGCHLFPSIGPSRPYPRWIPNWTRATRCCRPPRLRRCGDLRRHQTNVVYRRGRQEPASSPSLPTTAISWSSVTAVRCRPSRPAATTRPGRLLCRSATTQPSMGAADVPFGGGRIFSGGPACWTLWIFSSPFCRPICNLFVWCACLYVALMLKLLNFMIICLPVGGHHEYLYSFSHFFKFSSDPSLLFPISLAF